MLFDENGMFRLDEEIAKQPTFQKIMEDGIVSDEEVEQQSQLLISLMKKLEQDLSPEQLKEVEEVLTQAGVLYAISQYKQIQEFHH